VISISERWRAARRAAGHQRLQLAVELARWRKALAARPSVRVAVSADYPAHLRDFIDRRHSWLSKLQARAAA
jgi:hypothetical protein